MKKYNVFQKNNAFLIVLVTICLTRVWAISLFYIFGNDSQTIEMIVNDPWHHYQVGLVLIILAFLLRKFRKAKFIYPIGLGIILEEWPVLLNDLGLNTNHLYHSKIDFIGIITIVGLIYILSKILYSKVTFKSI